MLKSLIERKQKLLDGMNAQLELFEQDKQAGISQVAFALQKVYNLTHRSKMFNAIKTDELSISNRSGRRESDQNVSHDLGELMNKSSDLTVVTEFAEELSLTGMEVNF